MPSFMKLSGSGIRGPGSVVRDLVFEVSTRRSGGDSP